MEKAKVVDAGVDTLVLNAFYTDERGRPCRRELDPSLWQQLDAWKRAAQETHEEGPTTLMFEAQVKGSGPGCSRRKISRCTCPVGIRT